MEGRGRKSAASLSVIAASPVQSIRRPDAPSDLTNEQAKEWVAVVSRMPADWFPAETQGMLVAYCRHIVAARRVADMIQALEEELASVEEGKAEAILGATKTFDRLFKMQEREGRAISSLATKMRLSQQSTYDKSKKKPIQSRRPWED